MKRTLDFDLSDNDRRVVTAADKSTDYVAISRAAELKTAKSRAKPETAPYRLLMVVVCCVLLVIVVVSIVIAANANSSSGDDDDDTSSSMLAPTMMPPPSTLVPTTEAPAPPVIAVDDTGVPLVELTFLCNHHFDEGLRAGLCMAVFSVDNPSGDVVHVDYGANNYVEPGDPNVGQPVSFAAGNRYGGASFQWNCTEHLYARWILRSGTGTSSATAQRAHVECQPIPHT